MVLDPSLWVPVLFSFPVLCHAETRPLPSQVAESHPKPKSLTMHRLHLVLSLTSLLSGVVKAGDAALMNGVGQTLTTWDW